MINRYDEEDYAYVNSDNDIKIYLPKELSKNTGVALTNNDIKIEMMPQTERSVQVSKSKEKDNEGSYNGVLGEDTSIKYTATFEGFKEDIVLNKNIGINEFSFILKTGGLQAALEENYIYLVDPLNGEGKAKISPIYVYDSYTGEKTEKNTHDTYNNKTIVKEIEKENSYLITIIVDKEFLNNPETVYPIVIDPSATTINASGSGTSKTIQDAPIYSGRPTTSYEGYSYFVVGAAQDYGNGVGRTLMKFPGLMNNDIFQSLSTSQITGVLLNLFDDTHLSTEATIGAYYYTGVDWSELTAKCNTIGWNSIGGLINSQLVSNAEGGWVSFNLTSAVSTWKNSSSAANKGIILKNTSESSISKNKDFLSTESNWTESAGYTKPYISLVWDVSVTGISISHTSKTVNVNDSFDLDASVSPSSVPQLFYWTSSNTDIATVSSGGLVCAKVVEQQLLTLYLRLTPCI